MNEYQLLADTDTDSLDARLKEWAVDGWKLVGPVQMAYNRTGMLFLATLGRTPK